MDMDRVFFQLIMKGTYFGYPACCIAAFIKRYKLMMVDGQPDPLEGRPVKLIGSGYVPCPACNEKSEDELRAAIAVTRRCKQPFPDADFEHEFEKWFEQTLEAAHAARNNDGDGRLDRARNPPGSQSIRE